MHYGPLESYSPDFNLRQQRKHLCSHWQGMMLPVIGNSDDVKKKKIFFFAK
jgi:hypothetical protein